MTIKKLIKAAIGSLTGALAANLAYHLVRSYRQAEQVKVGALPGTEVVGAVLVPETTVVATLLAARVKQRPGTLGFLLGMALTLVVLPTARPPRAAYDRPEPDSAAS